MFHKYYTSIAIELFFIIFSLSYGVTTRYVNVNSAGGNGTTTDLSGENAAFATCSTGYAAMPSTISDSWVFVCHAAIGDTDTVAFAISSITGNSSTNYIEFKSDNDSLLYVMKVSGATHGINITTPCARVTGFKVINTGTSNYCFHTQTSAPSEIYFNRVWGISSATSSSGGGIRCYGSEDTVVINSAIFHNTSRGNGYGAYLYAASGSNYYLNNITFVGYNYAMIQGAGTITRKNIGGYANLAFSTGANFNTTTCDSTNIPLFIDSTNGDFRLAAGDTIWGGKGTDLSGSFTKDINGATISAWPIGASEPKSNGNLCAKPIFHDSALICTVNVAVNFTFKSDSTDSIVNQSAFPTGLTLNKTSFALSGTPTDTNSKDSILMMSYNCDADSTDTGYVNITTVWGNVYLDSVAPDSGYHLDTIKIYGRGFASTQGSSTIAMGDSTPTVTSWSNTLIKFLCPDLDTGSYDFIIAGPDNSDTIENAFKVLDSVVVEACTASTITAHATFTDTIGNSGRFGHVMGGGVFDSVKLIGTWPDSTAMVNKLTKDTVAYHWKKKLAKAGYKITAYSCTDSTSDAYDTITVIGPSVAYASSPAIDTVGVVAANQDPGSAAMADSFTVSSLPDGLSINKSTGRISGTPTDTASKAGYLVRVWRKDIVADSTFDTITTVWGNVYIDSVTPDSGYYLDTIAISGRGFAATQGASTIAMGDSTPTVTSWANTLITFPCPDMDTGSHNIIVTVSGSSDTIGFKVLKVAEDIVSAGEDKHYKIMGWMKSFMQWSRRCLRY